MTHEDQDMRIASEPRRTMPTKVKVAVVGLWLSVVIYGFGVALMVGEALSKVEHGQDGAPAYLAGAAMVLVLVALVVVAAVLTMRRNRVGRGLAIGMELFLLFCAGFGTIGALVSLDPVGIAIALVPVVIATGVVWMLFTSDTREWFNR